jgi:2-dehydropantoate 2-reductase
MPALQRRKLAINAVINPATALHNVNNGGLLSDTLRDEAMLACNEVADILRSIGDAALADQVHDIVTRVARETAANTSSMRADVMAGRGTEVEAILGYLLEYLKAQAQAPVATPLLDNWLQRLRNYEQERLRLPD